MWTQKETHTGEYSLTISPYQPFQYLLLIIASTVEQHYHYEINHYIFKQIFERAEESYVWWLIVIPYSKFCFTAF